MSRGKMPIYLVSSRLSGFVMTFSDKTKISYKIVLLCSGLLFFNSLCAEQRHFYQRVGPSHIEYEYRFSSPSGQTHKIKFKLDRIETDSSRGLFTRTAKHRLTQEAKQEAANLFNTLQEQYIEQARNEFNVYINEQARRLPSGINIDNENKGKNIRASSDGTISKAKAERIIDEFLQAMNVTWKTINQAHIDAFQIEIDKRTQKHYIDTYKQAYYVASFSDIHDKSYNLRIDFDQVAKLQAAALKPIADAIARNTRGFSKREVVNYTAHFIQSIPYDTLNSRDAHGETGFVAPLTLFDINKGDCDTKSTALAAILFNLYPSMNIKMVLIPNHAFLAIHLDTESADTAIVYHDREYVVVEAAGPALTSIGESYDSSLRHMQDNPGKIGRIISLLDKKSS